jgi:hypothetical protein
MTVKVALTPHEASMMIDRLRNSGLHPTELALVAPLAAPDAKAEFPVEVPVEEAQLAKELLESDSVR